MKIYYITLYPKNCDDNNLKSIETNDFQKAKRIFNLACRFLKDGSELEYYFNDTKSLNNCNFVVKRRNGNLFKEVVKGNNVYYAPYFLN